MVVTAVSITQDLGEKMTATNGVTVGPSRNAGGDSDQASGSSWLRTAPSWPRFTRKLLKGSKVLKVGEPGPLSYLGDNVLGTVRGPRPRGVSHDLAWPCPGRAELGGLWHSRRSVWV